MVFGYAPHKLTFGIELATRSIYLQALKFLLTTQEPNEGTWQ